MGENEGSIRRPSKTIKAYKHIHRTKRFEGKASERSLGLVSSNLGLIDLKIAASHPRTASQSQSQNTAVVIMQQLVWRAPGNRMRTQSSLVASSVKAQRLHSAGMARQKVLRSRDGGSSSSNGRTSYTVSTGLEEGISGPGRRHTSVKSLDPKDENKPEGDLGILPNTARYALYFVSVLSGTVYVAFKPIYKFMSRSPLSALAVVAIAASLYFFVSFVVQAMLGLNGDPFGGPVVGGT